MSYNEKIQNKKERYEQIAQSLQKQSQQQAERSSELASAIPMGQPLMPDHYSYRRDLSYRNKISSTMNKSLELQKKAEYYAEKAENVGTGGISSYDENAIDKLKAQLLEKQQQQEMWKAQNKIAKKEGGEMIERYQLTNNNANINRIKKRIASLEKIAVAENVKIDYTHFIYKEQDGRIMFIFDGKPADKVRELLKSHAFKWSPTCGAWVRMLTANSKFTTKMLMPQLLQLFN